MNPNPEITKLSLSARRVCELLSREPSIRQSDIASKLGMSYGGTKSLLRTLVSKGYINPDDAPRPAYSLTGKPFPAVEDYECHPRWTAKLLRAERDDPFLALEQGVRAMVRSARTQADLVCA